MVTYTKVLDVRKDLVVEGKVVAGDDIHTSILLDLPVGETKPLGLSQKVVLGDLATPVYPIVSSRGLSNTRELLELEEDVQASVAFFRSRFTPMRGKPRTAD